VNIVGYFHGIDPAACLVRDGELVAYVEEERLVRFKHAPEMFPIHAIEFCLEAGELEVDDIDFFAYGWDAPRYSGGEMEAFYDELNRRHPPDPATRAWQRRNLGHFTEANLTGKLRGQLLKQLGAGAAAELRFYPHHECHAAQAFFGSSFDEALVLTVDGSGDHQCATAWRGTGADLELVWESPIPHSLGWFYAAMTEYLGFDAYDGEYKVMGLAAYGRENLEIRAALDKVVAPGPAGFDFALDPAMIHHGPHTWSPRFTDHLVDAIGLTPRHRRGDIEPIHEDLAFETQRALETHALRLLEHLRAKTDLANLCLAGGVALNVKMNSRIRASGLFDEIFVHPIPSDSGTSIGAALGVWRQETGRRPPPLRHVYLGPSYSDDEIERQLHACGLDVHRPLDLAAATAERIAAGQVVGWFQGALEGGPRALGARSILADPRWVESRDRVNAAIKFREYWRPFCPSLTAEAAAIYMENPTSAPFMIVAFDATDEGRAEIPGVVHIDGTMRVQTVDRDTNPRYHALLEAFEDRTGVPVLLNTSFNVKGEPIVCSPRDALRTFWSTGLDALAIGPFILEKPERPS
jgi:carbamoyltransferase